MVYKKSDNKSKGLSINLEKYIFSLLILSYILGMCIGSFFVFSNSDNALSTSYMSSRSPLKITMYFVIALVLKYSGILSSTVCLLMFVFGFVFCSLYCF